MEFYKLRDVLSEGNESILFIHSNSKKNNEEARYLERPLIIANENDVVIYKGSDRDYLNYLRSINLGTRKLKLISNNKDIPITDLILNNTINFNNEFQGYSASFFSDLDKQKLIADKLNLDFKFNINFDDIKKFSDKIYFKELSTSLGIPIVKGEIFTLDSSYEKSKIYFKEILKKELKNSNELIVRASRGSGRNFNINSSNLESKLNSIFSSREQFEMDLNNEISYLIDPKIDLKSSPNVTFYINKLGLILPLTINDQEIKNLKHKGNNFDFKNPIDDYKLFEYSLRYANKIASSGYNGVFGIDFLKTNNGNLFGCEINLRINGNNYARAAIDQVENNLNSKVNYAYSTSLRLPKKMNSFKKFYEYFKEEIYNGEKISGIIPYNTYRLMFNNINVVYMGENKEDIENLKFKIKRKLELI